MTRAGGVVPVHGELRRRADHGRRDIANTIFHPVGTTKMGRDDDPMAVVDSRLRIRGMPGVRIVVRASHHERQHQLAHPDDRGEGSRLDYP
jgi:GMC oxidoreductase